MGIGGAELVLVVAVAVMVFGGAALAFVMAAAARRSEQEGRPGNPMWPLMLVGAGLLAGVVGAALAAWLLLLG